MVALLKLGAGGSGGGVGLFGFTCKTENGLVYSENVSDKTDQS